MLVTLAPASPIIHESDKKRKWVSPSPSPHISSTTYLPPLLGTRHPNAIPPHRHTLEHMIPTTLTHRRHTRTYIPHAILPVVPHQEALIEAFVGRHARSAVRCAEHFYTAMHIHIGGCGDRGGSRFRRHVAVVDGECDSGCRSDGAEAGFGGCAVGEVRGGAGRGGVGRVRSRAAAGLGGYGCRARVVGAVGRKVHFCVVECERGGEVLRLGGCEVCVVAGVVVVDGIDVGDVEGLTGSGV
jgi:hypothetical protein